MLPTCLAHAAMRLFHGDHSATGHMGTRKTHHIIAERFYWRGMRRQIRAFIAGCDKCMRRVRVPPRHRRYTFHGGDEAPNNKIAVDIVGPLTTTKNGATYIMTFFDVFSHWVEAYPLNRAQAEDVLNCLRLFISRHGVPAALLSDRGSNFLSKKVLEFLKQVGTQKLTTSPYHAATNGACEGFHKFLAKGLTMLVNEAHDNWDEHIPAVLFQYRTAPMDGTGVSPFEVTMGRRPNLPIDNLLGIHHSFGATSPADHADMAYDHSCELRAKVQATHAARFERNAKADGNTKSRVFSIGDKVYLKFPKGRFRPAGGSTKLSMINEGPYVITRTHENPLVYGVQHEITKLKSNVFVGRMIPFHEWVPEKDSIAFPFQAEVQDPNREPTIEKESSEDKGAEEDEYQYTGPSEQVPKEQREAFHKERSRKVPTSSTSDLRKPRIQTKRAGDQVEG